MWEILQFNDNTTGFCLESLDKHSVVTGRITGNFLKFWNKGSYQSDL